LQPAWINRPCKPSQESNRAQAREIGEKLAVIGCLVVPTFASSLDFAFDDEVRLPTQLEHERWMAERTAQGFEFGPVRGDRTHRTW
jgi:predicted cupin superfamily sugar epimerase